MSIQTTNRKTFTPDERKKLVLGLRERHQAYFDKIGEPRARFIAKMRYGWPPDRSKFFVSEISTDEPLYIEWVTRDYIPEDGGKLYKYKYNPDYDTVFKKETTEGGHSMYVVPTSCFELVKSDDTPVEEQMEFDFFPITDPDEDCALDNITLRDIAAILLKKPISRKEWLNKLIK
jgi:hypothetical protein